MTQAPGSFRLFRLFGVEVFVHWSWFLVAFLMYRFSPMFQDPRLHAATYGTLFGIVLLHEFGHALACRSVGGVAERIVLWPLGGIAFVRPPHRPGAVLWSIAAGPLVNVLLVPVTVALWAMHIGVTDMESWTPWQQYLAAVTTINLSLLVFNMLPIYPLDGGQIVQSLLWFVIGYAKSLWVTAWFGLVCAAIVIVLAVMGGDLWLVLIALFVASRSWQGIQLARYILAHEAMRPAGGLIPPSILGTQPPER